VIDPSDWDLAAAGMFLILMLYLAGHYAVAAMHLAYS
jgi:hypothetical protein